MMTSLCLGEVMQSYYTSSSAEARLVSLFQVHLQTTNSVRSRLSKQLIDNYEHVVITA